MLLKNGSGYLLVEVKSVGGLSEDFLENRVSKRQAQKLLQARLWLEEICSQEVVAVVALVMEAESDRVMVLPLGE